MRLRYFFCVFVSLMLVSELAFALQAIVVKGNRVLLSLEQVETNYITTNSLVVSTDKSAQVRIIQVRGSRAIGQVVKGAAKPNMIFRSLSGEHKKDETRYGFFGGVSLNTMTITLSSTNSLKLSGTGFNFLGFADYILFSGFTLRGLVGYESFKAAVASTTCPSGTCAVELNYLTASGIAQYDVASYSSGSRLWLGLGYGVLFAASASSEIINTDKMKTNQIPIFGAGFDYRLPSGNYFPMQLDYFLYPDGDIKTQQINIRFGYKF